MKETRNAAILLLFLGALLLFLVTKMHGETPRQYQKRVERRLGSAHNRLRDLSRFAHAAGPEAEYLRLADVDLALANDGLHFYRKGRIDRAEMDRLLKQLDRDMEDYPPQPAPIAVPANGSCPPKFKTYDGYSGKKSCIGKDIECLDAAGRERDCGRNP